MQGCTIGSCIEVVQKVFVPIGTYFSRMFWFQNLLGHDMAAPTRTLDEMIRRDNFRCAVLDNNYTTPGTTSS